MTNPDALGPRTDAGAVAAAIARTGGGGGNNGTTTTTANNNNGGGHHNRDTDSSGPYRDEDVLLSLQLLAYLSKYPHVRQAFYKPRVTFHPASLGLTSGARYGVGAAVAGQGGKKEGGGKEKEKEREGGGRKKKGKGKGKGGKKGGGRLRMLRVGVGGAKNVLRIILMQQLTRLLCPLLQTQTRHHRRTPTQARRSARRTPPQPRPTTTPLQQTSVFSIWMRTR